MPRPRPPHLHREVSRHGRVMWYVVRRDNDGRKVRLRLNAQPGTDEFSAEYQAAMAGQPRPSRAGPATDSLAWLLARYRETAAWASLSAATRRQRENIFKHVIESAGATAFRHVTQQTITAGRERRGKTPAQARNFLDAMRGLFAWAAEAGHVKADPTLGVKNPPRKAGDGFIPWTEEHVAAYWRRWPIGTRQRVWLDVLLYTGLRRGDAVRLGRQHVRDGAATIRTEKSGHMLDVTIPILPGLAATLEAGPCGDLTFIAGAGGRPLTKESFGNDFREACKRAGVPGSAHGVRKIAATTAANNGATVAQLKALFGWTSDSMPALYTKTADRRRLALEAGSKLANEKRTSMVEPHHPVRPRAGKSK